MQKPPLQFFLGALLIHLGLAPESAVMFCSLAFGVATLLMTALLANLLEPRYPAVPVLATVLMTASGFLVSLSSMKLLDTGYTFFLLASIYLLFKAVDDPKWWVPWGVIAGLGAVQKAPMALFASVLIFFVLNVLGKRRLLAGISDSKFRVGLICAIAPPLIWSLLQMTVEHVRFRRHFLSELLLRNTKGIGVSWSDRSIANLDWLSWFKLDSTALWLFVLITLMVSAGRGLLRNEPRIVSSLCYTAFVFAVFTFAGGPFFERYLITVTPIMAAVTAALARKLTEREDVLALMATLILALSIGIYGELPFYGVKSWNVSLLRASSRYGDLARPKLIPIAVDIGSGTNRNLVSSTALMSQPILFTKSPVSLEPGRYLCLADVERFGELQKQVNVVQESVVIEGRYRIFEFETNTTN